MEMTMMKWRALGIEFRLTASERVKGISTSADMWDALQTFHHKDVLAQVNYLSKALSIRFTKDTDLAVTLQELSA
jgi:hypothetical protein